MAPRKKPAIERLYERVVKMPNGCWEWQGHTTGFGYGSIQNGFGKQVRVHRLAYEDAKGTIPEGAVLDHLCRNRICVNPDHLEAVSIRENILRGEGNAANNAIKTHCKRGHPFDKENTFQQPRGRGCKTCRNERRRVSPPPGYGVKSYRGWQIDFDMKPIPYRGADWTATHPDYDASYEGPEDGWVGSHPVLTAATEKELWAEIDEWHLGQDDEDIAAIEKAAVALRSIAKRHGLTYASIDFHDRGNGHGEFWSAKGHASPLAKSEHAETIGKAIEAMLASEFYDTSEKAA